MKYPDKILEIIETEFRNGFILDDDVIHFAGSTLGMDREDLIETIRSGDPLKTGILDLVIIPGNEIRRVVEKYIPPEGIDNRDAEYLTDKARSLIKTSVISIKGGGAEIRIEPAPGLVEGYINRLLLTKEVPCKEPLPASGIHGSFNLDLLVYLRKQGPVILNRKGIDTCRVITLLRDSGTSVEKTIEAIDFLSDILKRYPGESDILSMAVAERSFWLKMLEEKKSVEEAVEKYSMEFVLMQKINPGLFSLQDIERKIDTANRVLELVYGNIELF